MNSATQLTEEQMQAELNSVIDSPDEDRPRLEYADVWEQRGGEPARASLIRLQLQVATALQAFDGLRLQALQLIAKHGVSWIPTGLTGLGITEPKFVRGFIECVTVTCEALLNHRSRRELFQAAPIRHLNVVGVQNEDDLAAILTGLDEENWSRRILSLGLDGQNLGDRAIQSLADRGLRNLQWLSLAYNNIGKIGVLYLAEASRPQWGTLRNLRYVNLEGNPFNPVERIYEDQGVAVWRETPEAAGSLPDDVAWLHRKVIGGQVIGPERFALRLAEHSAAGAHSRGAHQY